MTCQVVEFGSKTRGDSDLSSDRDILLIGKTWSEINTLKEKYKQSGYSVSAFKEDKARFLINHGSLFFKHILDEGVFVDGEFGAYSSLISNWSPARDYEDEIDENLDLLEVLSFIPETEKGITTAIDILICSVRNILIRRLANQGSYVFSWSRIFNEAKCRGIITGEDISVFICARKIKNSHREGKNLSVSKEFLEWLRKSAIRACGVKIPVDFATHKSKQIHLPDKFDDGTYKQLRALELMCATFHNDASLIPFLNAIKNPSYFCSS